MIQRSRGVREVRANVRQATDVSGTRGSATATTTAPISLTKAAPSAVSTPALRCAVTSWQGWG